MIAFPKGFLWGATTSAYQVEGGNFASDWWRWEQRPGRIRDRRTSQAAADHAARYEADFDLARKLGHNAHLFSVEWGRVQPEPERFDHEALAHYASVAEALARNGLEPIGVLNHVTLPYWLARRGGWLRRDAPDLFAHFAERTVEALGEPVQHWVPLYEPEHTTAMAWIEGLWPPGKVAFWNAYRALQNQLAAYGAACRVIRRLAPHARVGVSIRGRRCLPAKEESPWDLRTARRENRRANHLFPEAVCRGSAPFPLGRAGGVDGAADFIALSYYGKEYVRFHPGRPLQFFRVSTDSRGEQSSPCSYEPDAAGLTELLRELARYQKPLLVAGNGIGTQDDSLRCRFLLDHVAAVHAALAEGIEVRGYLHRSFLDGFEWTDGYTVRYGLVHVDRETMARTPNPSAYLYKDICESGSIRSGAIGRFAPDWKETAATS